VIAVPTTAGIHKLFNNDRSSGSLLDKKPAKKCYVLIKEKLDKVGARLEHTPQKSLRCLAQEAKI
jgi:hypothetical protein